MPIDTPLVLTHDHDPKVVFRGQLMGYPSDFQQVSAGSLGYGDLWANLQGMNRAYNELLIRNKELSDAHKTLQGEYNSLRDTYWSLHTKHQELADDTINARIQSWRHVVRVEELENELRLLRQSDHQPLSKRKFADIQDGDNDGAESDWSASSRSHSKSVSNDTLHTPASRSSKVTSAPFVKDALSEAGISYRVPAVTSSRDAPQEPSTEIRTPKRHKHANAGADCDPAAAETDSQHPSAVITPIGKSNRQEDNALETHSRHTNHGPRPSPQIQTRNKSSRHRRPQVEDQNATAAAVAAALSGAPISHHDHSTSPSPPERPLQ